MNKHDKREEILRRRKKAERVRLTQTQAKELLLPLHMLSWLLESIRVNTEHGIRPDFEENLSRATQKVLTRIDDVNRLRVAQEVDEMSKALVQDLHVDDVRQLLVAWCQVVLKLVDEGLHPDSEDQAVLTALAIAHEAMDVDPQAWVYRARVVGYMRDTMMNRLMLSNLYAPRVVITP